MNKKLFLIPSFLLFFITSVSAHCPLCTIGAAAAAGGAAYLGVSKAVIGIFIGGFAVSMGWWISRLIKKQFVPYQRTLLILFSFGTTIIPLVPLLKDVHPLYISLIGEYGSLLNRTYLFDLFFIGSVLGGIIVCLTPWMSSKITSVRDGKMIPFQGFLLTLIFLVVAGALMQLAVWL